MICQKEEHLRPDHGLTTGSWSHGGKSEDKGVGRLPYDLLTSIFPKTFLKPTLLSVLLNFGGIFKLVSLTFFFTLYVWQPSHKTSSPKNFWWNYPFYFIHHSTLELIKLHWNYMYSCQFVASRKMWKCVESRKCFISFAVDIQSRVEDKWMIKWFLLYIQFLCWPNHGEAKMDLFQQIFTQNHGQA